MINIWKRFEKLRGNIGMALIAALVSAPVYAVDLKEVVQNPGDVPGSDKPSFSWEECVKDRIEENGYSSENAYKACDADAQREKRKKK